LFLAAWPSSSELEDESSTSESSTEELSSSSSSLLDPPAAQKRDACREKFLTGFPAAVLLISSGRKFLV